MKRAILILGLVALMACGKEGELPGSVCVECYYIETGFVPADYCSDPVSAEVYKREMEKTGFRCKYK